MRRLSRRALLVLGIYATVLALVVVAGFMGAALGIWASILWAVGVLAEAVRAALVKMVQAMPVHACFGFLNPGNPAGGNGLPMLRTLQIGDFPLFYPRKLSKHLNMPGPLGADSRQEAAEWLATAFSPA